MGFYNVLFGVNPHSDVLLEAIGLTRADVGRFRDAWVTEDGREIAVYTRNGGNNRAAFMPDLSRHPLYLRDADDIFDNTYATIFFRVPESFKGTAATLAQARHPDREWIEALDALKSPGSNPDLEARLAPVVDLFRSVLKPR